MMHHHTRFGDKQFSDSKILSRQSVTFWKFAVTLTLNIAPFKKKIPSNQVWSQKAQQYKKYSRNSRTLIIWALTVTLTLKIMNQFFCIPLWLTTMYHHTKVGNKMFGLDNHSLTFLSFAVILTMTTAIQFFTGHSGLWWYTIKQSLVANGSEV